METLQKATKILLQGGEVLDLAGSKRQSLDLLIIDGRIARMGADLAADYEGELLDVDAYNQPGVEESKIATYAVLGNTGDKYRMKGEEMKSRPVEKKEYIL